MSVLPLDVVLVICSYIDDVRDVRSLSKALGCVKGLSSLYYTSMVVIKEKAGVLENETRCTLNTTTFAGGLLGPQYVITFTKNDVFEVVVVKKVKNKSHERGRGVYSTLGWTTDPQYKENNKKWSEVDPEFKTWVEGINLDYRVKPKLLIRTKVPRKRDLIL